MEPRAETEAAAIDKANASLTSPAVRLPASLSWLSIPFGCELLQLKERETSSHKKNKFILLT